VPSTDGIAPAQFGNGSRKIAVNPESYAYPTQNGQGSPPQNGGGTFRGLRKS
jgi:hypothetical protein